MSANDFDQTTVEDVKRIAASFLGANISSILNTPGRLEKLCEFSSVPVARVESVRRYLTALFRADLSS